MSRLSERQAANLRVLVERELRGEPRIPSGVGGRRISRLGLHGSSLEGLRTRGLIYSSDATGWLYVVTPAGYEAYAERTPW